MLNTIVQSFIQHLLIGGTAIAVLCVILENFAYGIEYSSYLYAALPTVYFYLYWVTYYQYGNSGIRRLNIHLILGTLLFLLFVATTHITHLIGFNHYVSFAVAFIVFGLVSTIYFMYFVN